MSTETPTTLPERDYLQMRLAIAALQLNRGAAPSYRVIFRIALLNDSRVSVRLHGRKWTLRDRSGATRIIEAERVFNQYPVLMPGCAFSFSGFHDFSQPPSSVTLRLFGSDQAHSPFITPPLVFDRRCFQMRRS